MSNVGRWDTAYAGAGQDARYGDSKSYRLGADWLTDCDTVEDWGCGLAWFSRFLRPDQRYVGVDGSQSEFRTRAADLEQHTSAVPGVFMRHVLEHNYRWQTILDNALGSFTERMCLVLFTPWQDETVVELRHEDGYDVPTLGFSQAAIEDRLGGVEFELVELQSPETFYGAEHVYLIGKP